MTKHIFISLLFFSTITFAQKEVTESEAERKLKNENFEDALVDYLQLLNKDPKNELYNYYAGVCCLNSNSNKAKAIPYLEIVTRKDKYNPEADYLLARAYQYAGRYDDAIKMYDNYKVYLLNKGKISQDVNDQIQYCLNAKELVKFPVNVTFQTLGKNVNSEYNDYYPFVTANESFMMFNSKRPEKNAERMENGEYKNSILISKVVNGQFTKATNVGAPLNIGNAGTEIIGLSANGETVLLLMNSKNRKGNVFISKLNAKGVYSKPEPLSKIIDTKGEEIAASISNDGVIYFASNRDGGFGGYDLYSCRLLPNGKWAEPQNLGPNVNTKHDEDFPNISPDGKTIYFSSKGHTSMGGYDIFKADYDETTLSFTNAKNIGYPINTAYDDMNFRVSKNGKYGYMAAIKANGLGEYDIYRVNFNDVESQLSVVLGDFTSKEKVDYRDVFISVNDLANNELVGNYLPNPNTGHFIMILKPGKYQVTIETAGFKTVEKTIEVFDKSSFESEIEMKVELEK